MEHPPRGADPARDLALLLARVRDARRTLVESRHQSPPPAQKALRLALLEALEAYADALTAAGAPLPYKLRDEMGLLRGLRSRD